MNCPLCCSERNINIEKIKKSDLIKLYNKHLRIDVSYLVKYDIDYYECVNCGLKYFFPLITGDEKFYADLQKFDWYYMDDKYEYEFCKRYIEPGSKVLEVGCGKGAFAKHIPGTAYVGLEFSKSAKDLAAREGIAVENISIQEYSLQYPNFFDVVVSFQVLEHVSNPKSF